MDSNGQSHTASAVLPLTAALLVALSLLAAAVHLRSHRLPASQQAGFLGIPGAEDLAPSMEAEQAQVRKWLAEDDYVDLEINLDKAIGDYKQGRITDIDLRDLFFVFEDTKPELAQRYDRWWAQYPKSYAAHLARGIYFRSVAGERRGDDYFSQTPASKIDAMEEMLGQAFVELQTSLSLDDKPILSYMYLISVGKHERGGRYLRQVLDDSLKVDPKNFIVRRTYLRTLRPRWGGSMQAMLDFVQECRAAGLPPAQISDLEGLVEEELGWEAEDGQQFDDAILHYANAVRVFPHSADSWIDYARVLYSHADCARALPVLTRLSSFAGQLGSEQAWAHSARGWCLEQTRPQSDEAFGELRAAAELGDAWAENELGEALYAGRLVSPDPNEAMEWLQKAAAQGNEQAKRHLAQISNRQ